MRSVPRLLQSMRDLASYFIIFTMYTTNLLHPDPITFLSFLGLFCFFSHPSFRSCMWKPWHVQGFPVFSCQNRSVSDVNKHVKVVLSRLSPFTILSSANRLWTIEPLCCLLPLQDPFLSRPYGKTISIVWSFTGQAYAWEALTLFCLVIVIQVAVVPLCLRLVTPRLTFTHSLNCTHGR